ncbi:MAG: FHA domain-containing protein [Chloroflexota bacterium]
MAINFFLHSPLSDNMQERKAVLCAAALLQRHVGDLTAPYTLIANIEPTTEFSKNQLPQLDALLLAPKFAAIIELKSYFEPVIANHLTGKWKTGGRKGSKVIPGGSQKNPFLQVKRARLAWQEELNLQLYSFLLFYPYLHPDSKLPLLGPENYWLAWGGIDELKSHIISTAVRDFSLSQSAQQKIAKEVLGAQAWSLSSVFETVLGFLHVVEPKKQLVRYPIRPFDTFTIGRSRKVSHMIYINDASVSSSHLAVTVQGSNIEAEDLGSKNGTYLNGIRQTAQFKLQPNQKIHLGHPDSNCIIWFTPTSKENERHPTLPTV